MGGSKKVDPRKGSGFRVLRFRVLGFWGLGFRVEEGPRRSRRYYFGGFYFSDPPEGPGIGGSRV